MNNPVFAVGVGTDLLSIVRTLGAKGVACWACASHRVPGTVSRYARFWRIPDPQNDEQGMIDRLLELAERVGGRPVIFTGCDQHAQALARHRDLLEKLTIPCIADSNIVELMVQKRYFSEWAAKHAPSYPCSVPATSFQPSASLPFPVIAKPNHRGYSNAAKLGLPSEQALHERRLTLLRNKLEWEAFRRKQADYLPHMLIQQYIAGTSASKFSIGLYANRDSEIKGVFIGRRVRGFPALYGDASLVESAELPEAVMQEAEQLIKELGFFGIAEAEYNQDANTGEFHLLEINPRCWGWIGITAVTDANILWVAYQDLTGGNPAYVRYSGLSGATKLVMLTMDMANVFIRYRSDHPAWVQSPAGWWRSLRAQRLVIWEFDRTDLRGSVWCFIAVLAHGFRYALRKTFGR